MQACMKTFKLLIFMFAICGCLLINKTYADAATDLGNSDCGHWDWQYLDDAGRLYIHIKSPDRDFGGIRPSRQTILLQQLSITCVSNFVWESLRFAAEYKFCRYFSLHLLRRLWVSLYAGVYRAIFLDNAGIL